VKWSGVEWSGVRLSVVKWGGVEEIEGECCGVPSSPKLRNKKIISESDLN
jgi:hypothetical protein